MVSVNKQLISISEAAKILGISIDTLRRWDKSGGLSSIRTGLRGHRFYNLSDVEQFTQDQYSLAKKWAGQSEAVEPEADVYCQTRDLFQARLEKFQSKLQREASLSVTSLIVAIAGEIGNNSYDHNLGNWPDITGVYFSYFLKRRIIVLADRGQGILTTLKRVRPDLFTSQQALKTAFTETISGRQPEARGNGLKFVRNVIIANPFTLFFQTGDAYLYLKQNDKDIIIKQAKFFLRGCFAKIEFEEEI